MTKKVTADTHRKAHDLRDETTIAESKLWSRLRRHQLNGIHFRQQHPIGKYVVDICAPREKLIIEIDGGQHIKRGKQDDERTRYFETRGYRVLRFWNNEVFNHIDEVIVAIEQALEQ